MNTIPKINKIYHFWFVDEDYESGDTCYIIIAKNKIRAIEIVKKEYGRCSYENNKPLIELIGYTPLKENDY